MSYTFVHL